MERVEDSRKGKHLNREERIVIERMSRGGIPPSGHRGGLGAAPADHRAGTEEGASKTHELRVTPEVRVQ